MMQQITRAVRGGAPLRLMLVDDHPILRAGLCSLLASEPDFDVVAECSDGSTVIAALEASNPDLIVMDVSLKGLSGADVTRLVKHHRPDVLVLALSVHEEIAFARLLLDAGASGYALKRSACDELIRAVRAVASGNIYVDPSLAARVLKTHSRKSAPPGDLATGLSDREAEAARLFARGLTMKEMAQRLAISPRTLETYRSRAMEKLGLTSRAELISFASRCGWLNDE